MTDLKAVLLLKMEESSSCNTEEYLQMTIREFKSTLMKKIQMERELEYLHLTLSNLAQLRMGLFKEEFSLKLMITFNTCSHKRSSLSLTTTKLMMTLISHQL
jgi:hypothetical protein